MRPTCGLLDHLNARNIYERPVNFPERSQIYGPDNKIVPPAEQGISRGPKIIADGSSNAPGSARGAFWPFPKVAKLKRWGKKVGA